MDRLRCQKIYNFSFIKNLNDYTVVLKQSLKYCDRNKYLSSNKGNLYMFRWSNDKKRFVLDFNTSKNRDIEGIDSDDITEGMLICKQILDSLNSFDQEYIKIYNLFNPFKALVFEINLENNLALFLGIWNIHSTKNREGSFDLKNRRFSLLDFKCNIDNSLLNILSNREFSSICYPSYMLLYEDMLKSTQQVSFSNKINNLTFSQIIYKYKNVKKFSEDYNIITRLIENKILELIKEEKIIYQHEDYLVSITSSKVKVLEEKIVNKPLGIFTI
jgi:hypothetical protein